MTSRCMFWLQSPLEQYIKCRIFRSFQASQTRLRHLEEIITHFSVSYNFPDLCPFNCRTVIRWFRIHQHLHYSTKTTVCPCKCWFQTHTSCWWEAQHFFQWRNGFEQKKKKCFSNRIKILVFVLILQPQWIQIFFFKVYWIRPFPPSQ